MSNKLNHRDIPSKNNRRRSENTTHMRHHHSARDCAKGRKRWKRIAARSERRQGQTSTNVHFSDKRKGVMLSILWLAVEDIYHK